MSEEVEKVVNDLVDSQSTDAEFLADVKFCWEQMAGLHSWQIDRLIELATKAVAQ